MIKLHTFLQKVYWRLVCIHMLLGQSYFPSWDVVLQYWCNKADVLMYCLSSYGWRLLQRSGDRVYKFKQQIVLMSHLKLCWIYHFHLKLGLKTTKLLWYVWEKIIVCIKTISKRWFGFTRATNIGDNKKIKKHLSTEWRDDPMWAGEKAHQSHDAGWSRRSGAAPGWRRESLPFWWTYFSIISKLKIIKICY